MCVEDTCRKRVTRDDVFIERFPDTGAPTHNGPGTIYTRTSRNNTFYAAELYTTVRICRRKISLLLRHYIYVVKKPRRTTGLVTPRNPRASLICISVPADDDRRSLPCSSCSPTTRPPSPSHRSTIDDGETSPFIIITRLFITLCKYITRTDIVIIRHRRLPSKRCGGGGDDGRVQ